MSNNLLEPLGGILMLKNRFLTTRKEVPVVGSEV
jgi:hypothetical protein